MTLTRKKPMARGKGLARSAGIGSGTRKPLKARNPKRRKAEFARAYGGADRVAFVKSLPCAVCLIRGHTENAHVGNGGMGRKSDYRMIVPLCAPIGGMPGHHELLHAWGRKFFEASYGVDLDAIANATERAWLAYLNRTTA